MIDWAIGLLQEYATMGNAGQLAFVFTILAPLAAVFALTRAQARRGFETSDSLKEKLQIARNDATNLQAERDALTRENADLTARLPESFISRLDAQLAQGNDTPATRDVYDLLSGLAPALTAAFAHLAREETKNVAITDDPVEQAKLWRLARDNARIALAFTPDHAEMAALEEELSAATDLSAAGLKVTLPDDAIRALRWVSRLHADRSYPALMAVYSKTFAAGRYLLALSTATEARRLASRQGAELSREALYAGFLMAQAMQRLGRYPAALKLAREVEDEQTKAFGADDPDTLLTRYIIANILSRQGDYIAALTEVQAVRSEMEARANIGPGHPDTLATRYLTADILSRKGDNDLALAEAEAVWAAQEARADIGPDHPDTLVTRHLIADILSAKGDYDAALKEAQAVRSAQEAGADIGPLHPETLRTGLLIAEIHGATGDWVAARAGLEAIKPKMEALGLASGHTWLKALEDLERFLDTEAG